VVVNAGAVIAEGSPAEIGANRDVIQAYLGEEYVHAQA
jgi:ABC-type branched-subunit amino acid transport system ATPase component